MWIFTIGGSALTSSSGGPKDPLNQRDVFRNTDHIRSRSQHNLPIIWSRVGEVLGAADIFIGRKRARLQRLPSIAGLSTFEAFEKDGESCNKGRRPKTIAAKIHTPLIAMTKAEIIKTGLDSASIIH